MIMILANTYKALNISFETRFSLHSWVYASKFANKENFPIAVKIAIIRLVNHTIYGWLPSKSICIPCR